MASELRHHAIRVLANYAGLIGGFIIGVVMVPILLRVVGEEGFGVIGLLGGTTGILLIIREVVNKSLTREIGAAYHESEQAFREHYASAITLSCIAAVVTFGLFLCLIFVLPYLKIPDALMSAARWMVVIQSFEVFVRIATAAPYNLMMVQERFIAWNVANFGRRAANLVVGIVLLLVYKDMTPSGVLVLYAILISALYILLQLLVVAWVCWKDRRAIPRMRSTTRAAMISIAHTAKWNIAVASATTLHLRVDLVLMSVLFGIIGASVMTVGVRLTGYMRQLVYGITGGLDAVAVRISHSGGDDAMRTLIRHTTRIHAIVVIPAAMMLILFADPLVRVWVTSALDDPESFIRNAAIIVQALTIGFASRAIADSWMHLMYGAGHVRRYAPLVASGAVLNPILGLTLYALLPESIRIASVAAGTSMVFFFIHFIGLPIVLRRTVGVPLREAFSPMILPTVLALVALPAPLVFLLKVERWSLLWLMLAIGSFGAVYAGLCLSFAMDRAERALFLNALRRRLPPTLGGKRVVADFPDHPTEA